MLNAAIASVIVNAGLNPDLFRPEPHRCGLVFISPLTDDHTFFWVVPAGRRYVPERHQHQHKLTIRAGNGIISINGKDDGYREGDQFVINAGDWYGLVWVETSTLVHRGRSVLPGPNLYQPSPAVVPLRRVLH